MALKKRLERTRRDLLSLLQLERRQILLVPGARQAVLCRLRARDLSVAARRIVAAFLVEILRRRRRRRQNADSGQLRGSGSESKTGRKIERPWQIVDRRSGAYSVIMRAPAIAAVMIDPTRSAAASASRSPTWAYLSVMVGCLCPSIRVTVGSGTPRATAWLATVWRTSPIPASSLARRQKGRLWQNGLAGSRVEGNTKVLPVRGWRAMTTCAASLSHTVRGLVLVLANLSMSPSTSDHRSVRISLFRQPVSRSRRMMSACGRREGRSSTSRSRVR